MKPLACALKIGQNWCFWAAFFLLLLFLILTFNCASKSIKRKKKLNAGLVKDKPALTGNKKKSCITIQQPRRVKMVNAAWNNDGAKMLLKFHYDGLNFKKIVWIIRKICSPVHNSIVFLLLFNGRNNLSDGSSDCSQHLTSSSSWLL